MTHLSMTFFGTFQVTLDSKSLTAFRSSKVQSLLAYLALTNKQSHPREVLATFFWPDEPGTVARKNLRQSLYQLRQVLKEFDSQQEPHLLVSRSTVQFNPASDYSLDVRDFLDSLDSDQLEQAVAIYRGDLLPGFTCDSVLFDEWLRQEREQLHRLALTAFFELTEKSLAAANYLTAQSLARQQLELEPWREEAYQQLMQALALMGERSAALAQYETCQTMLKEELGIEPSAETEALAARIRNQQQDQKGRPALTYSTERRWLVTPFVGRKDEYRQLIRTYQTVIESGSQVMMLIGEAGIGKTRLAQNFLEWADLHGADVLRSQAFQTSRGLSYQAITDLLRKRLDRENAPDDLLSDLWLTQLSRVLPELRDRYPDLPEPTQETITARQHLFEAITRLGQALAERRPLILFIDDCHWADAASLDVLHYAALRWAEERIPILILLTLRQEDLTETHDFQTWVFRLKHDVPCTLLNLAHLSRTETEQLIHTLLEPTENHTNTIPADIKNPQKLSRFSNWLFDETSGQPFFLKETLKALVEDGVVKPMNTSAAWQIDWEKLGEQEPGSGTPVLPGVRGIIRGWLDRISNTGSALLTAAAVLGQEASFDNLRRVAGLEEIQALTALDELLMRQLLLEAEETSHKPGREVIYNFSHHKVAELVYTEAGAARRRILHRRALETLEGTDTPVAELAHHAQNAGLWMELIQYSLAAGNTAMDLLAVGVAITHYETAWQLVERIGWPETISGADIQDLFAKLGRAYELAGSWLQAQETYQAMINYARTIGAPTMECLGLNLLATVFINGFKDTQQAITLIERARVVAEQNEDQRGLAETEWNFSVAFRMRQEISTALHHGEKALPIARQLEHPQLLARCLNSLSYIHSYLRRWDKAEVYANEARQLYAASGNQVLAADSQRIVGWAQMYTGWPQTSLATLEETFAFSQQIENLWGEAECGWRLAHTMLELGRYGQAIRHAREAIKQARLVGIPIMILLAQTTWGVIQRTVMTLDHAEDTLLESLAHSTDHNLTGYRDWILFELCSLHAIAGDWDQAYIYARQALQSLEDESILSVNLTGWYMIEALLRSGDVDLARAEVERLEKLMGNNRRYRLVLLRSQAVLAQWDDNPDQAVSHLQAALALTQEIGLPGEEWQILGELAKLYAGQDEEIMAQQAYKASSSVLLHLAETIDEEEIRSGFLAARQVRSILNKI